MTTLSITFVHQVSGLLKGYKQSFSSLFVSRTCFSSAGLWWHTASQRIEYHCFGFPSGSTSWTENFRYITCGHAGAKGCQINLATTITGLSKASNTSNVQELEALPAGTKPRTWDHRSLGGKMYGQRQLDRWWRLFFLACEDFGGRFDESFPACTFFLINED